MQILGMAVGLFGILVAGILLLRGIANKSFKQFPVFYSYIIYVFCWSIFMYGVHWLDQAAYPSTYWFSFLINILVEFSVLIEISDHIFKNLPALRYLGRAITIAISTVLALIYILPVILGLCETNYQPKLLPIGLTKNNHCILNYSRKLNMKK